MNGRESRAAPKAPTVTVDWKDELWETDKLSVLLSTKGAEERTRFLAFAIDDLAKINSDIGRHWFGFQRDTNNGWSTKVVPIITRLLESPSSGTDLAIQVASLATLWILSTEGDASTKMLGQFLEGTYQLAMTSFGKLHAPALRAYITILLFANMNTMEDEVDSLFQKVLLPTLTEVQFDLQYGGQQNDVDQDEENDRKTNQINVLINYLQCTSALLTFVSKKVLVQELDLLYALVEDLLSYDHEELKVAAAEVAMACVDLMRRYNYHEFDSKIDTLVTEVFRNMREPVGVNISFWRLLGSFLTAEARSANDPVAVLIPFLHVEGQQFLQTTALDDKPYFDRSLRYAKTNPTTGFAEAMTFQFFHKTLGGTIISSLFNLPTLSSYALHRGFVVRVVEILSMADVSGDLRAHISNYLSFASVRRYPIGESEYYTGPRKPSHSQQLYKLTRDMSNM